MDNADLSVLRKIQEWQHSGHPVVMGTIVKTWGSAPRPVGSIVAVRGDGHIAGSVSGGCIEDDLIEKVRARSVAVAKPERIRYGISAEEANRFGLPCGGTLELVLETIDDRSLIDELLARLQEGERIRRVLDLTTGAASNFPATGADVLVTTDETMTSVHGPRWRLLVVGAGQMTQYLAAMAVALDYDVTVCDPRVEYTNEWDVAGTKLVTTMPDDAVIELMADPHTAVIALTHDPKLDDLALMEALRSKAFYVGAIGSRANQAKRRERLLQFDVTEQQLARLHGPVGIKNGARTPAEIAVAILAELTAERYGYEIPPPVIRAAAHSPDPDFHQP